MARARRAWPLRVLVGLDQLANITLGPALNLAGYGRLSGPWGDVDETISGVLGKLRLAGVLERHRIARAVAWALDAISPGHTLAAVELEDGMSIDEIRRLG